MPHFTGNRFANCADSALEHINSTGGVGTTWVVQKYLERPLLVSGRKFDIRAYALVTPHGNVYLHRESYVRTSSMPFSLGDLDNRFVLHVPCRLSWEQRHPDALEGHQLEPQDTQPHKAARSGAGTCRSVHLTNDAIQVLYDNYGQHEDHNKLSLEELQAVLKQQGSDIDVSCDILPQMREATRRVFSATLKSLNTSNASYCFELMGLDFMVGSNKQARVLGYLWQRAG
jgi:Tubulin-tyrosine ligase family